MLLKKKLPIIKDVQSYLKHDIYREGANLWTQYIIAIIGCFVNRNREIRKSHVHLATDVGSLRNAHSFYISKDASFTVHWLQTIGCKHNVS